MKRLLKSSEGPLYIDVSFHFPCSLIDLSEFFNRYESCIYKLIKMEPPIHALGQ